MRLKWLFLTLVVSAAVLAARPAAACYVCSSINGQGNDCVNYTTETGGTSCTNTCRMVGPGTICLCHTNGTCIGRGGGGNPPPQLTTRSLEEQLAIEVEKSEVQRRVQAEAPVPKASLPVSEEALLQLEKRDPWVSAILSLLVDGGEIREQEIHGRLSFLPEGAGTKRAKVSFYSVEGSVKIDPDNSATVEINLKGHPSIQRITGQVWRSGAVSFEVTAKDGAQRSVVSF